jgi:hypothetical protein
MITKPPFGREYSLSLPNARSALRAYLTASSGSTIFHDESGKEMDYEELSSMAEREWQELGRDT